jgi:DNA-directed RNA polymerase specialized sigma24 family protein
MKEALQPLPASDELPAAGPQEARNPAFDALLDPPEFLKLRGRLVRIFSRRGCSIPEDLADETISRVLGKLPQIADSYEGDPLRFFHAVARNVYREHGRRPRTVPLEDWDQLPETSFEEVSSKEQAHECLESCLSKLNEADRQLIREYYRYDKLAKIDRRKTMAAELGIAMNTLRIKAFRIRQRLSGCVVDCAKKRGAILK